MFTCLFIDLDDTVLDFHAEEAHALDRALRAHGFAATPAQLERYNAINKSFWARMDQGELTREQVLVGRFTVFLAEIGAALDPAALTAEYERNLWDAPLLLPGAKEALARLSRKYRLFLASNGNAEVQAARLAGAGLYPYFEQVFISQEVGFDKPSPEYFAACFARIPGFRREEGLMVGDSLTSDMAGGRRAGLATCWVNPQHLPRQAECPVDYEIESLARLEALLDRIQEGETR